MQAHMKYPALFTGLGITLLFLTLAFVRVDFIDSLQLKFYDFMMNLRAQPEASSDVVIVDIDDDSIDKLGRWPWPRSRLADIIRKIDRGNPRLIGLNIILSEPESSPGLEMLRELDARFAQEVLPEAGAAGREFLAAMRSARARLDNDRKLAQAIRDSGRVVLPVFLKASDALAEEPPEPAEVLIRQSVQNIRRPANARCPVANVITHPLDPFLDAAEGIGHINLAYDIDGKVRWDWPLYEYNGIYLPSYPLKLAALYLNLPAKALRADIGSAVRMGSSVVPITPRSEMLVSFKGGGGTFKRYSFFDVLHDKVPARVFADKIVLISPSAAGLINPLNTPTDNTMTLGEFTANTVWSLLRGNAIQKPAWAPTVEFLLILLVGLVTTLLLPRMKPLAAGGTLVFLGALLVAVPSYFFAAYGLWVPTVYPLLLLFVGYIGVISLTYLVTEKGKRQVEGESAETNRMLGLSFQSQGMLDMAFDKFRRVPVDDQLKDNLYNLGLDYERKRQFNKAASVYGYIEQHGANYKDVAERKQRLIRASETMVFGDGALSARGSHDLLSPAAGTRPTLGRYEIVKQLGRGAMGVVYLGLDPRINRTTAIKTFAFSDELSREEVDELKEKFFREAESAGTLSHPNIVTIYDAGDEQDLAYIAMEYLEGVNLERFTKKDNLLPMRKVLAYLADVADALDYAHQKGIVHRDIKPANLMLLGNGVIKITDFGIARITATSQTQTGVVKGTPYYMSPEQFSGEKVDGRSDIFSLGTTMYQLLTGQVPFRGDTPAALMNQIMNVSHPDPKSFNPRILNPIAAIVDKALAKRREDRYKRAKIMASHLREIAKRIDMAIARKKGNGAAT